MTARQAHNSRQGRTSSWIRRVKRLAIYIRDGFTCQYCGTDLRAAKPHEMGLDHLTPQCDCPTGTLPSGKSLHHESNLVTACRRCNSSRQDRPWRQYATAGAVARIQRTTRRKLNMVLAQAFMDGTTTWEDR